MTEIIIKRDSEWMNKARIFLIYLNGKKVGSLGDGETLKLQVPHGTHELIAKVDRCSSPILTLDVSTNEQKTIKLATFKFSAFVLPVILGIMAIYYILKYAFDLESNFLLGAAFASIFYPMYYITFGKNKYLRFYK